MNAYKCDRCHKFYTENPEMRVNTARATYRTMHIVAGVMSKSSLDICPRCKESFEKWFENPVFDEKEGEAE